MYDLIGKGMIYEQYKRKISAVASISKTREVHSIHWVYHSAYTCALS